jgi:hypothetical protein
MYGNQKLSLWISIIQSMMDWSPPLICDKIWCCLVIKSKEVVISIHFLLWGVWALCCLTNNHCHIPWEGGVKSLWVFKF